MYIRKGKEAIITICPSCGRWKYTNYFAYPLLPLSTFFLLLVKKGIRKITLTLEVCSICAENLTKGGGVANEENLS